MKKINILKLFAAALVFFTACEPTEDTPGVNNPEELVGNWLQTDIEAGMEITVNTAQNIFDPFSPGTGSGITIAGDGITETLNYLSPIFMFMDDDCPEMDCMDDGQKFYFAAQNLDWSTLMEPGAAIGQTLKTFLILADHDYDEYGAMMDTLITRAVYFEWVIQDSFDIFPEENERPDIFYMADEVIDFTIDTTALKLTLNNLKMIYGDLTTDSSEWDSIGWDSTRWVIANGDLASAEFNIAANTPTAIEFHFWDDKEMGGAPVSIELFADGTMEMEEFYWECDMMDDCEEVTENISGEWWIEGLDTLILELPAFEDEPIDTVELIYFVSGNDLTVVHRENPCDWEDEYWTKEDCMNDFENELMGMESGSLSELEIITTVEFTKSSAAAKIIPRKIIGEKQNLERIKNQLEQLIKYIK